MIYFRGSAAIAQWIEQIRPKDKMWVRFLLVALESASLDLESRLAVFVELG